MRKAAGTDEKFKKLKSQKVEELKRRGWPPDTPSRKRLRASKVRNAEVHGFEGLAAESLAGSASLPADQGSAG
jgi:hypothetical protein